jgi:hypothetical protein
MGEARLVLASRSLKNGPLGKEVASVAEGSVCRQLDPEVTSLSEYFRADFGIHDHGDVVSKDRPVVGERDVESAFVVVWAGRDAGCAALGSAPAGVLTSSCTGSALMLRTSPLSMNVPAGGGCSTSAHAATRTGNARPRVTDRSMA